MRTIFLTLSGNSENAEETLQKIKQEFLLVMSEDFLATGMTVIQKGCTLVFNPKNFSHNDVVTLMSNSGYNYSDFDGISFPTTKYSAQKEPEYYFEKRFDDYDFTIALNTKTGIISISDVRYVDVDSSGNGTSLSSVSAAKKIEQKKNATMDLLMALRVNSKYKQMEEYSIKNGIIRADIKLSKLLFARVFVDVRSRIKDYLMVGYFFERKFIAISHLPLVIATDSEAKKEANKLERILYGFYQKYQRRVEKAFYEI